MTAASVLQIANMSKIQKLAALLVMLGPDNAAPLLKSLREEELENVSAEMARLSFISQELQEEILAEFSEVAVEASTAIMGGANCARNLLEKSVGASKAAEILRKVTPAPLPEMEAILEMEDEDLFALLKAEQPQTVALIVSYLAPGKGSRLLTRLSPNMRELVVERLATLGPTPVEVVERIVKILNAKRAAKPTRPLSRTGGLKSAANLLNILDRSLSQTVLMDLEKRNPSLGQEIRATMFTFEDLAKLSTAALQRIMRDSDMRDLALAFSTAAPELRARAFSVLSKRAAATVAEEISMLGAVSRRDVEAARQRVIALARQLENGGEIDFNHVREFSRHEVLV